MSNLKNHYTYGNLQRQQNLGRTASEGNKRFEENKVEDPNIPEILQTKRIKRG
jgi:hypothetical protein